MASQKTDFTLTFRSLSNSPDSFLLNFEDEEPAQDWLARWNAGGIPDTSLMKVINPVYIPRNHRIEEVIEAANRGNFNPFHELHKALQNPYNEQEGFEKLQQPPRPEEIVCNTFCGT